MKRTIFLLLIFLPLLVQGYTWDQFGPPGINASNFQVCGGGLAYEIICADDGLWVYGLAGWQEYSYSGLPVWDTEYVVLATADLLVALGNGSYSDGIYFFNFSNYEFVICHWFVNPRFITYSAYESVFYAGGEDGLIRSEYGTAWEPVPYFQDMYCYAMDVFEEHYVVATDNGIHFSPDGGGNWQAAQNNPWICDLCFTSGGTLYGIFPDESFSSGLWSSSDFGNNWEVEFWDARMSSVTLDLLEDIFVGWELPNGVNEGVASWDPVSEELTFYNDGLPCLNINKLTLHPLIDCNNIVCCTDEGVFMLTNYEVEAEDEVLPLTRISLVSYPNPFNPATTIRFQLPAEYQQAELTIYNLKGQQIHSYPINSLTHESVGSRTQLINSVFWDGTDAAGQPVPSGIYLYQLRVNGKPLAGSKGLLLK